MNLYVKVYSIEELRDYIEKSITYFSDSQNLYYFQYYKKIRRKRTVRTIKNENELVWEKLKDYCTEINKPFYKIDVVVAKKQICKALEDIFFDKDKEIAKKRIEELQKYLIFVNKFIEIKENKRLECSKSPYSMSFYLHKNGEIIDWDFKPEGSYRLADHWNFFSHDKFHCISDEIKNKELAIGIYCDGKYKKVEI